MRQTILDVAVADPVGVAAAAVVGEQPLLPLPLRKYQDLLLRSNGLLLAGIG